jgi:hypothetical protein
MTDGAQLPPNSTHEAKFGMASLRAAVEPGAGGPAQYQFTRSDDRMTGTLMKPRKPASVAYA